MKKSKSKQKGQSAANVTAAALMQILDAQLPSGNELTELSRNKAIRLAKALRNKILSLDNLARAVDPVVYPNQFFDPSDPKYMGRIIAATLLAQEPKELVHLNKFYGSGVYAIYYNGSFAPYAPLSGTQTPIYAGKADPKIAIARTPLEQECQLYGRLIEHRKSIKRATNIAPEDFTVRYLITASGFQTAAELFLISYFKPVWNKETGISYGVGKHGDKATTRTNKRSPWDTLHPGRKWAAESEEGKGSTQIRMELEKHFKTYPAITEIDFAKILLNSGSD